MTEHEVIFDYSLLVLGVAITTSIGVIITAIASIRSANSIKSIGEAQLMEGIEKSLKEITARELELTSRGKKDAKFCDSYATDYLNLLDRLGFLRNHKKIDKKIVDFFEPFLGYGLLLLDWKEKITGKDMQDKWADLVKVCKENNVVKRNWESTMFAEMKYVAENFEASRKKKEEAKEG